MERIKTVKGKRQRTKHNYLNFFLHVPGLQLSKKFYKEDLFSPKFINFYYHSRAHKPKNNKMTK